MNNTSQLTWSDPGTGLERFEAQMRSLTSVLEAKPELAKRKPIMPMKYSVKF
jgi:hypothetical protein